MIYLIWLTGPLLSSLSCYDCVSSISRTTCTSAGTPGSHKGGGGDNEGNESHQHSPHSPIQGSSADIYTSLSWQTPAAETYTHTGGRGYDTLWRSTYYSWSLLICVSMLNQSYNLRRPSSTGVSAESGHYYSATGHQRWCWHQMSSWSQQKLGIYWFNRQHIEGINKGLDELIFNCANIDEENIDDKMQMSSSKSSTSGLYQYASAEQNQEFNTRIV